MSDAENAAAAATSPAVTEGAKPAVTEDAKPAVKDTASAEAAVESKAKTDDAGEEKWPVNGTSKDKDDRKDRHDRDRRGRGRGRGQGRGGHSNGHGRGHSNYGHSNYKPRARNNEFEDLPESDNPVEIRNQVEFYFSAHNLATDYHLFELLNGPENRPVPIKHIHGFKRMRRFQPYSAVVNALRESQDVVVVDDGDYSGTGNEAVKCREPLVVPTKEGDDENKPTIDDLFSRLKEAASNQLATSIYAKNFGDAEQAGQIALEKFFRPFGAVMVRKRRDEESAWKGSVFVVFESEDAQKQFLALDPAPKFNGNELVTMGKKEYNDMKCKEKGIEPDSENGRRYISTRDGGNNNSRGRGRGRDDRGRGRDSRGGGRGRGLGGYDRRRDRSASNGSVDSRDWNGRRDRFQKGKNDRGNRKEEERKEVKEIERDGHGVPIVKDTRADAEMAAASKKRKGDDEERAESPKKNKMEIKLDE